MKRYFKRGLSTACAIASFNAMAFDFDAKALQTYECERCEHFSQTSLGKHWPTQNNLSNAKVQNSRPSFSYRLKTNTDTLGKQGLALNILGQRAVIRIHAKHLAQFKNHLILQNKQGQTISATSIALANPKTSDNFTPWKAEETLFLQLPQSAATGQYRLRLQNMANAAGEELYVQVIDRQSGVGMHIDTDKVFYQHGDTLKANIYINGIRQSHLPISEINAYLRNDANEAIALEVHHDKDRTWVEYPFNELRNSQGAPWYLMVEALADVGDMTVKRNAHAAISYAIPSAAALSLKQSNSASNAITIRLKASVASRYQVQAVLYQKGKDGSMHPVEISEQTAFIKPGEQDITLQFDNKFKHNASYAVGNISIIDYGQMQSVFVYNGHIPMQQL